VGFCRAIKNGLSTHSPDGRPAPKGAETALERLREFDPGIASAKIDLSAPPPALSSIKWQPDNVTEHAASR
jgi:hypothetical protein